MVLIPAGQPHALKALKRFKMLLSGRFSVREVPPSFSSAA